MDENNEKHSPKNEDEFKIPESPKPLAFTVDFGDGKTVDTQRHKTLVEKFQKKHRRGQSLSKLEEPPLPPKKHPHTGNLPRKSSFQSEGYFSSDEKSDRVKKRSELSLPLKTMSNSFFNTTTPEIELKDVSSPELDVISPFSPKPSSPDADKSDTVSDAGTYTLDADNYSEEQKARMSIDAEFKIEQISVLKKTEDYVKSLNTYKSEKSAAKMLSPILSPTQNLSITDADKTFTKIMFPSPKAKDEQVDQGSVISVTSSGAFRVKERSNVRKLSLTKSEIQVEAYVDGRIETKESVFQARKLTANIVQSISVNGEAKPPSGRSPTKIPSPLHARPRSRNGLDLSDSSLETESYLKPTQNCINALQQRLSLDSDQDSDYGLRLNNTLLKQRATHIRHNSLDDKISNKLEHFQNKNLQAIDQTCVFNQYRMHKVQNSPNNSPIRRSSSFSAKNQINAKNTNVVQDLRNSPSLARDIQRSASTANIKPSFGQRRASVDHQKIDRNQFGDTESSSEEDFEKSLAKKKDLSNLTNTRYNRAFSLRRGRLDEPPKCPNTPEMRRKFQPEHHVRAERAISMDRKPVVKTNEVQSRYLLNVSKKAALPVGKVEQPKMCNVAKISSKNVPSGKPQVFSRTDSGRFSMRTNKTPTTGTQKTGKKDGSGKKSSGRSNSSLSSREKEFQNWKRRKSYDPMKAAAEGKRKEMAKRQNMMTQSYTEANQNQDCDSSPSHSSSVHRSQSFHGTAALEQLISSEEEEDLTLSADEGFSPPTPSPCDLSPARASLRNAWKDHVLH